jgi:hypothetical protein
MSTESTDTPTQEKEVTVSIPEDRVAEFYAFYARFLAGPTGRRGRGPRGRRHGRHGHGHGHGRCGHRSEEPTEAQAPTGGEVHSASVGTV